MEETFIKASIDISVIKRYSSDRLKGACAFEEMY
jgi:hypothetical protein